MTDYKYKDIIHLTRPVSRRHPKMALQDRAAQFAPFAALSGFKEGIQETTRKTTHKKELDENEKNIINDKLTQLVQVLSMPEIPPEVTVRYFVADELKEGGAYETKTGQIKKIDLYHHSLVFTDGTQIDIENLMDLETHFRF